MNLGDPAPSFSLPDVDGVEHRMPEDTPATVVLVTCNHCPYVVAWNPRLRAVAEDYTDVGFLAIHSNDWSRYPADSPQATARFVRDQGWPIPSLIDATQEVAQALDAQTTPHVFVFDGDGRLAYQGAPDADHQDPSQNASYLRSALDAVLAGSAPDPAETPPRGCSVKWR